MATYTAAARKNPGRQKWLVEFRHPLRMDSRDKPGRKTRKGLGTDDPELAKALVARLNELLADPSLWSIGARAEAARRFPPAVIDIFYGEIEARGDDARALRDRLCPLPAREDGYARVLMIGVPGAGKTTLVRQLIGTHPKREAFPSTSMNRTTTFPTEIVARPGNFEAAVSFMSEHEARFEVEECISSAVVEAISGTKRTVARDFLEKSDMRMRLKYVLGDLETGEVEQDPYSDENEEDDAACDSLAVPHAERTDNAAVIEGFVDRIMQIADQARAEVEAEEGPLPDALSPDRSEQLDLIEERAVASDLFLELVSDVLDEIRVRFDRLAASGKLERTTTGWPRAWQMTATEDERPALITSLRYFSGTNPSAWGRLVTPLVNGLRVQGPFQPNWTTQQSRLVLIDTEGLGHKSNPNADLSEQTIDLLHEADVILLVDSVKQGLTNFAAGKALETIAHSGLTRKLALVFTHMDRASESGLTGARLTDQIFSAVRNLVDNQLSESLTAASARYLLDRLNTSTFYVGRLDKAVAKGAEPELIRLLTHLMAEQPPIVKPVAVPGYDRAFLMMALQEAARDFRRQWHGILNISADSQFKPKPWQTIKALSRRYAENWGEDFELRPAANLRAALETAVSRYLENPVTWTGHPTSEQKREAIEQLKTAVSSQLAELARNRLRQQPQQLWHEAWIPRGNGSTFTRRLRIETIYQRQVPIPDARGDTNVVEFMAEIEKLVDAAVQVLKAQTQG